MTTTNYRINSCQISLNIRDDADESVAAEIFKWREYRIAENYITDLNLPIFDVGAHAGFFSLYARALNKEVDIVALEPEPNNLDALKKNVLVNKIENIIIIPGALAGKSGRRTLEISSDSHNHKLNDQAKTSITVKAFSLNNLNEYFPGGIGLMKMDIEGGEYEVFANLTEENFASFKAVLMEYHDLPGQKHQKIEQTLREHGFGVQVFPSHFDKTMGFIWATNKRH